ncbi:glycosyltransferase family 1 protein [Kineococcus sp. NUM-3379]
MSAVPGGRVTRLAVDGRVLDDNYHGIGRITEALLRGLAGTPHLEVAVFTRSGQESSRFPLHEVIEGNGFTRLPFEHSLSSATQWIAWPRALRSAAADVALFPYHLGAPVLSLGERPSRRRRFAVVHDCILEADAAYAPDRRTRALYTVATRLVLRATTVLTPSHASAQEVRRTYGVPVHERNVVGWGVDDRFAAAREAAGSLPAGTPSRYLLHVGARRPHKNVDVAVRALASLPADVHLVLVGSLDRRFPDLVPTAVRELGLSSRVVHLQGISDGELMALYAGAHAFVYPSAVEGFGLPLLEAMAAGVPVVASDIPVFREVGGDAALFVPPGDPVALAGAVRRLDDPGTREALVAAGRARARQASWARATENLLVALGVRSDAPAPA